MKLGRPHWLTDGGDAPVEFGEERKKPVKKISSLSKSQEEPFLEEGVPRRNVVESAMSERRILEDYTGIDESVQPATGDDFTPIRTRHIDFVLKFQGFVLYLLLPFTWSCGGKTMHFRLTQLATFSRKTRLTSSSVSITYIVGFLTKVTIFFPLAVLLSIIVFIVTKPAFPMSLFLVPPALLLCESFVAVTGLVWKDNEIRMCRLRRIRSLTDMFDFEPQYEADWVPPPHSGLLEDYVCSMREGHVAPMELLKQILYGVRYSRRFTFKRQPLAWACESIQFFDAPCLFVCKLIFRVGLTVLPVVTMRNITYDFGTLFCFFVYAVSVWLPNTGLDVLLDCTQVLRDELVHQRACLHMLGSMLSAPRKWEWLPKLRYDRNSDLLAWAEIYEYVEYTPSSTLPFVLASVGTNALIVYFASLLVTVFSLTIMQGESDQMSSTFVSLIALSLWAVPFVAHAILSTVFAGMHVNTERKHLMEQLSLLVMCQHKCISHIQSRVSRASHVWQDLSLEQGQLQNFKDTAEFTRICVERWEGGNCTSSLLGISIDARNITAILVTSGSMFSYVIHRLHLSSRFQKEFCLLLVEFGFQNYSSMCESNLVL